MLGSSSSSSFGYNTQQILSGSSVTDKLSLFCFLVKVRNGIVTKTNARKRFSYKSNKNGG